MSKVRAQEAKIRKKIRGQDAATRWLLRGFSSPEEALSKLNVLTHDVSTGQIIKRCIQAYQAGPYASEALDLLTWAYTDVIKRYCSNVGQWFRADAEQESLLAVIETAQTFKPEQYAMRFIAEAFRKAVIRRVRAIRYAEMRRYQLSDKLAEFLQMGFFCGEELCRKGKPARTTDLEDANDVIDLLLATMDSEGFRETVKPWVQSCLLKESMMDYARRESPDVEPAKASLALRKRVARVQKYLRRRFKNQLARPVAVECLLLAGRRIDEQVAMSRLEREVNTERTKFSRRGQHL